MQFRNFDRPFSGLSIWEKNGRAETIQVTFIILEPPSYFLCFTRVIIKQTTLERDAF